MRVYPEPSKLSVTAVYGDEIEVTSFAQFDSSTVIGPRVNVVAADGSTELRFRAFVRDGWKVGDQVLVTIGPA